MASYAGCVTGQFRARRLSLSCTRFVAPIMVDVMNSRLYTHANANCVGVRPICPRGNCHRNGGCGSEVARVASKNEYSRCGARRNAIRLSSQHLGSSSFATRFFAQKRTHAVGHGRELERIVRRYRHVVKPPRQPKLQSSVHPDPAPPHHVSDLGILPDRFSGIRVPVAVHEALEKVESRVWQRFPGALVFPRQHSEV